MTKKFDLVAIGSGSGASAVASRCRAAGWQVALVDSLPFGGTCALRGCDPKKVLVGAAEVIEWARRMQGKGVRAGQARIEWPALMRFKRSFTQPMPKLREKGFAKAGIAALQGRARFVGPTAVEVGKDVLEARHVVIATGAAPAKLRLPGAELLATSDDFLELKKLPRQIVFVGGGYISVEFAHVAAQAGARVTVLHRGPRLLVHFDADLVELLTRRMRARGIEVRLNTEVEAVEKTSGQVVVRAATDGKRQALRADLAVHGAGRVPDLDDLNLEAAGVERERSGVKVNQYLQSVSNPAVYAAGDAAASGGPPLTPVAGYEGQIVAANLLEGNRRTADYAAIPTVAFSLPPLAAVGVTEEAARTQGLRFRVRHQETSGWYSSRRVGEECSGFKVLVEEGSERILGAHLLGPQAEETINLFAVAMRAGLKAGQLKELMFAYPTHASDVRYML